MCGRPLRCKMQEVFFDVSARWPSAVTCQVSRTVKRSWLSKVELPSYRLSCKPHIRRGVPLSHIRDERAPRGRHHSVKTAVGHHAEQRRRPLGPVSRSQLGSSDASSKTDQHTGFIVTPFDSTPCVTKRHSAISSLSSRGPRGTDHKVRSRHMVVGECRSFTRHRVSAEAAG